METLEETQTLQDVYNFLLPYAKFTHLTIAISNDQYNGTPAIYLVEKGNKAIEFTFTDGYSYLTDNINNDELINYCKAHHQLYHTDNVPTAYSEKTMYSLGDYFTQLLKIYFDCQF